MQINDIVIMKEDNKPRNQWQLARIVETHVDKDNFVRKVKTVVSSPLDSKGSVKGHLLFWNAQCINLFFLLTVIIQLSDRTRALVLSWGAIYRNEYDMQIMCETHFDNEMRIWNLHNSISYLRNFNAIYVMWRDRCYVML